MNPAKNMNEAFVASHSCTPCSLLSKELNVQESDTTGDEQSGAAKYKKYKTTNYKFFY